MSGRLFMCVLAALALVGISGCDRPEAPDDEEGPAAAFAEANRRTAETDLSGLVHTAEFYHITYRAWPRSIEELAAPGGGAPLLDKVPIDPWGTPYVLRLDGETLRILSAGGDKEVDTDDDVVVELSSGS